ncbi:hypothetical protein N7456_011537 [Penicillium angulare]|uniref:Uncharacterized protein n=1 Tax=Penicillium angulare TaxID=116970 RepID=A0A9W9EU08_9EURO|nr:hypothetical protein N7456_011537 [Penicillium angulare]
MHFFNAFLPIALLATPIFASPVDIDARAGILEARAGDLEARAGPTVTCRATDKTNAKKTSTKSFTVEVDVAKDLVKSLGVNHKDSTGYPHAYTNKDKLTWNEAACKKTNIDLLEYPVFWKGAKPLDQKKSIKNQAHSPIRVVYANSGGSAVYCGIMTHTDLKKDQDWGKQESWIGSSGFVECE